MAQYRAADWNAAVETLGNSVSLRSGGDSLDFFFLAMAEWQLGNSDQAMNWHQRGVEWIKKNQTELVSDRRHHDELQRFRAEAEELLRLKTGQLDRR